MQNLGTRSLVRWWAVSLVFCACSAQQDTGSDSWVEDEACVRHNPEGTEWRITVHGMSTSTYIEGGSGWTGNFVIVDLTFKNIGNVEDTFYWARLLEDSKGYLYQDEVGPCLQLDSTYGGDSVCLSTPTLNPGTSERGVIVFDVNKLTNTPFALRVYEDWLTYEEEDYSCISVLTGAGR